MAYWSYARWDLALEDLILHCPSDLVDGVVPYYDGSHWKLLPLAHIAEDLPEVIAELEEFKKDFDEMVERIDDLFEKAEELAKDNPEEVRFALVQMDWDTETTFENNFITPDSDVTPTWLSWEPNGIIETYVWSWFVIVRSSDNENWIVRLRISKAKESAYLNSF